MTDIIKRIDVHLESDHAEQRWLNADNLLEEAQAEIERLDEEVKRLRRRVMLDRLEMPDEKVIEALVKDGERSTRLMDALQKEVDYSREKILRLQKKLRILQRGQ